MITDLRLLAAGVCLATLLPAQIRWLQIGPSPTPRRNQAMACDDITGRMLVYGGETLTGTSDETFEWNGSGWAQTFTASQRPAGRINAAMVFDSRRGQFVMFGGYDGTSPRDETWECGAYAWIRRNPAIRPPARASHGMAYDAARQRTVLFGGFDGVSLLLADTWEWDGTSWIQRTPATSPPATLFPAMTFDAVRRRVLMFGSGFGGRDTWEWDGTNWLRRTPATSPPAQVGAAIAFDPSRNRTVLLGGGETWEWDGGNWRQRTLSAGPTTLARHSLLYDVSARRIVAFGGTVSIVPAVLTAESWEFDGTTWMLRDPGTAAPPARRVPAMTFARTRAVLFGGNGNASGVSLNDTWEHDGTQWLAMNPTFSPAPRESTPLVYDSWRDNCVLFGGINSANQYYTDTWTWSGTNWTPTYAVGPPPRFAHAMAFDAIRGVVVLFGGSAGTGPHYGDTWTWDGTTWTQRFPASTPGRRFGHGMAFDAARGKVVLRAGLSRQADGSMTTLVDSWEWDGANWLLGGLFSGPAGATLLAYHASRRSVVGLSSTSSSEATYEGNNTGWFARSSFFVPRSASDDAMAYDSVRERTMLFGGGLASGNQTWILGTSTPATFRTYGSGCAGASGTPSLSASGLPWLGTTLSLGLSGARPMSPGVLLHGFSAANWAGLLLPYDLATFGAPTCTLYNSGDVAPGVTTDATGSAVIPLFVPLDSNLVGLRFYDQFATFDPAANARSLVFTPGGVGVIGMR